MKRITICLKNETLNNLDEIILERDYKSRSQAISDFIGRAYAKKIWRQNKPCVAVINLSYYFENIKVRKELDDIVKKYKKRVVFVNEILYKERKFIFILLKGLPENLQKIADEMRGIKKIESSNFSILSIVENK